MAAIRPDDLPAAVTVAPTVALIIDNGTTVEKATPLQLTDAARPLASQPEAEAGANNAKIMSPLRVAQAVEAQIIDPLASPGGSQLVTFQRFEASSALQNVETKLSNLRSVPDFTTPAAADANGGSLFVPSNVTSTVANGAALAANYWGPAQIITADTNKRGKWFSNVTARPSAIGMPDSIDTAFNGDWSHCNFAVEHRITGAGTLGTPATGYMYTDEACAFYGVMENHSGHNQATASNVGRTSANFFRLAIRNYGQGDCMAYNATAFVTGAKPGATSFLANPAVSLFTGDIGAGANGVYLNPREIICSDNGYDVACVGDVINMVRTNNTGALGVFWTAYRAQNQGTVAPDNVLSAVGDWKAGVDFTPAGNFTYGQAAIALKAGHRILFSATSSNGLFVNGDGGDFIEYSAGIGGIHICTNNATRFQVVDTQITTTVPMVVGGATPASAPGYLGLGSTTAGAAGAAAGEYLVISVNGNTRKIALLNV